MKNEVREIVYILPDHVGGVASVVGNLLKYSSCRCKKKVILLRTSPNGNIPYNFDCDKQIVININKQESLSSIYTKICSHISDDSVVISNDGWYEIDSLIYCKKKNPIIYILHGNFVYYYDQIYKHRERISKVIAVSSFLKRKATEFFDGETKFIPFPIDPISEFDSSKYDSNKLIINYVGRLEEKKGTQFFPELTSCLDLSGIKYELNIFGTGEHEEILRTTYCSTSNIYIHGLKPKTDILNSNLHAHILLLLSKTEGLPTCVVEAMKGGMVPIVFDIPSGIPDIIQDGKNGFILPQGDVNGVVTHIVKLFNNRYLLREIGINARSTALEKFDPTIQAKEYENEFSTASSKYTSFGILRRLCLQMSAPNYYRLNSYYQKILNVFK